MSVKYFVRANTSSGLSNRIESNLKGVKKIYVISGNSSFVKSMFIGRIGAYFKEHGEYIEYILSPFYNENYDGIIVRQKKIAVLDEDCLKNIKLNYDCAVIDTDICIENNIISEIKSLNDRITGNYSIVYKKYEKAKRIHDEWENLYIKNMNLTRLNSFNDYTITKILDVPAKKDPASVSERFFGSVYADGHINYIDNLTKGISKRYFIKGRPGTGKSTFMRRFASRAAAMGYDTEVYFCSFDPYSYDMVIVRDLSVCVFDSTSPHEKMPEESNDEILDFYVHSGLSGVDKKLSDELSDIKLRYNNMMSEASVCIKNADELFRQAELLITPYIDYEKINNIVYDLLNEIY